MNIHNVKQPSKHPKIESYRISMRKLPNFSKKVTEFLCESYVISKSKQTNPPQKSNH